LTIDGQMLSAWCAWDTLFLPELLGQPAEVESQSPGQAGGVKLIVTAANVDHVEPEDGCGSLRDCPPQESGTVRRSDGVEVTSFATVHNLSAGIPVSPLP
jgi:hypothetical protein